MIICYGAGKEFERLINNNYIDDFDYLVDSYSEKYKKNVCGYKVYDNSIISKLTENDMIYITANDSNTEQIYNIVVELNPKVSIIKVWQLERKKKLKIKLEEVKKLKDCSIERRNTEVESWLSGVEHEIDWWKTNLSNMSLDNPRLKYRPFYCPYMTDFCITENDIIMDVGSGPFSHFGHTINGKRAKLIAVDALAYTYRSMLDEMGFKLPLYPEFALMECLSGFYPSGFAKYVLASNTIDHSIDAVRCIVELFEVVAVGGVLIIAHNEAEGEHNNYTGLHMWNFTEIDGELILFNRSMEKFNITKLLADCCDMSVSRIVMPVKGHEYRDRIIAKIHKTAPISSWLKELFNTQDYMKEIIKMVFRKIS